MKCPNCSFENTEDNKTCRVCGFDLKPFDLVSPKIDAQSVDETQPPIDAKISKRRMIDDTEDEALDSAFKSIFELKDDGAADPLDGAAVERILQKKRPDSKAVLMHSETDSVSETESLDETDEKITYDTEDDHGHHSRSRKKVALIVILLVVVLLLLGFKYLWPNSQWQYVSNIETTEPAPDLSTEVENTTEPLFSLGDDASLMPVNDFYNLLPEFINRGNLSILSLFDNSQEALEVLTSFAVIGNLEKIVEATVVDSEVTQDSAVYRVTTLTNRLISGQQTQTASIWDFRAVLKNDKWLLESLAIETGLPVPSGSTEATSTETATEATTEASTETTTEKQVDSTTEPSTENNATTETATETTTEQVTSLLKGFKSTGSFSGGEKSSRQDVAFARYGYHDTFERLAFDLYEWVGDKPNQTVDVITNYTANISEDGQTINIVLYGAVEAYASHASIDLVNSKSIESVSYNYFGYGEAISITITLKQPSQFKVFNLVSPAKLVVDIAPIE